MSDLYELYDHAPMSSPVMIIALDGWIDAGTAAGTAMSTILSTCETDVIASFDTDELLDHRARRPMMNLEDGHMTHISWPAIELRAGLDEFGNHITMLVGAEPDHLWGTFYRSVVELAEDLDTRMIIGLGAYPAPVPHTRETNLALTSPSRELLDTFSGFFKGTIEVPAGIQSAIELAAYDANIPSVGLWAQIPHYVTGMTYPAGSAALLDGILRVSGISINHGDLLRDSQDTRVRLDALINDNQQYIDMVHQLENAVDTSPFSNNLGPIPSGDELAAEVQRYLDGLGDK